MKVHHTMLLASMIAAAPLVAADRTPEKSNGERSRSVIADAENL